VIDSTPGLEVEGYPPQQIPHSGAEESYSHNCAHCKGGTWPTSNKLVAPGLGIGWGNWVHNKNVSIHSGRTHCRLEISLELKFAFSYSVHTCCFTLKRGRGQIHRHRVNLEGYVPICCGIFSTNIAKQVLRRDRNHTKKSTMVTYSVTYLCRLNDIERVTSDLTLRLKIQALPCPTLQVGQDSLHGIVNHGLGLLRSVDHGPRRKIMDQVKVGGTPAGNFADRNARSV
jgi:hypothetical protein